SEPAEIKSSKELSRFINSQPELKPYFNKSPEDNGLVIEGVAVQGKWIHFGMRGPVLDGKDALILAVPLSAMFDGQNGTGQLHRLDLGGRGVRDLVAFEDGFLVIAGPVLETSNDEIKNGD